MREHIIGLLKDILEVVKAGGDMGTPSGHIYNALMGVVSYSQYQGIIGALQHLGCIKVQHNCLIYVADLPSS